MVPRALINIGPGGLRPSSVDVNVGAGNVAPKVRIVSPLAVCRVPAPYYSRRSCTDSRSMPAVADINPRAPCLVIRQIGSHAAACLLRAFAQQVPGFG